ELLSFISTVMIAISAVFIVIGWRHIVKGEEEKHKKAMITSAIFALFFFIIYVSRTTFLGSTSFGGPDHIKIYYIIFLIFHIVLATTGAVFGVFTFCFAFKVRFK